MDPADPSGSCADYAAAWGAMTAAERECHTATVCCAASNGTDTEMCATKDGCMGSNPAPTPAPAPELPDYQCTGSCHIHSECESHGDHDHVHYHHHDCVMDPADPSGSCADYAAAWGAMTAAERECHTATLCCAASNGTDTAMCETKDGSGCTGSSVEMV